MLAGELEYLTLDRPAWTDRFNGEQLASNTTTSGQEWDQSDTDMMTISNKLSARYQRRRRAVDR